MTDIPHPTSFSGKNIHTMPMLLVEAVSLVTTRSVTNAVDAAPDPADLYGSSGRNAKAVEAGEVIGIIAAVVLWGVLDSLVWRDQLLRPKSENYIFRRCCGNKRKRCGPPKEDYQPYEMMRPQGQHRAEAVVNKGFENQAASEAQRMLTSVVFERSR